MCIEGEPNCGEYLPRPQVQYPITVSFDMILIVLKLETHLPVVT
jgi:hypothetical protein